jgi:hypothetical protein
VKRERHSSPDPIAKKLRVTSDGPKVHGKFVKEDMTRGRFHGNDSSQESDDSYRDEILQKAFGVSREQVEPEKSDETSSFLAEHRKKETEWRKKNLG